MQKFKFILFILPYVTLTGFMAGSLGHAMSCAEAIAGETSAAGDGAVLIESVEALLNIRRGPPAAEILEAAAKSKLSRTASAKFYAANLGLAHWVTVGIFAQAGVWAKYRVLKLAEKADESHVRSLETTQINEMIRVKATMSRALEGLATRFLSSALLPVRPRWAEQLRIKQYVFTRGFDPGSDTIAGQVALESNAGRGPVSFDVYFEFPRAEVGRMGIVIKPLNQPANIFYYDDFKPGSVVDAKNFVPVAHSAVDARRRLLGLAPPLASESLRLAERMNASPVLRRQVHLVLGFAARKFAGQKMASETTILLRALFNYWTYAPELRAENMLKSGFLIQSLGQDFENQRAIAHTLLTELSDAEIGTRAFSPSIFFAKLNRTSRLRLDSDSGVPDFWPFYLTSGDGMSINKIDSNDHAYPGLVRDNGSATFDDPAFVEREHNAYPESGAFPDLDFVGVGDGGSDGGSSGE